MNKEDLEKRLQMLTGNRDQLIANVNLVIGQIQEVTFQISQLNKVDAAQEPQVLEATDSTH